MRRDLAVIGLLFLLPLILFWQQTVGGATLLPSENLYQYEPYATYAEVVQVPSLPHNALLSDLVLQNFQWKAFIRDSFAQGEIPLWNPHQFAGIPFMAAGQQSTLYPLSLVYYVLPLPSAYGWFTLLNLWLAGAFMYALMRGLGTARLSAALSGITYQLAGMFVASAVHPMIIGTIVWMPLLLLMGEYVLRARPFLGRPARAPWMAVGAAALAFAILAGHVEIMIYTLLILAYVAGLRLLLLAWTERGRVGFWRVSLIPTAWLGAMVGLGIGIAAIQLVPLYEFVSTNWRAERGSLETVLSYAHPARDLVQYVMPNFYGSPAQHSLFDVFGGAWVPLDFVHPEDSTYAGQRITNSEWGIKNYVEAALYVGILPLMLAAVGLIWPRRNAPVPNALRWVYGLLALLSLSFMFGLPTYALIYWLPGINQLNTAFRWVFGVTVAVAVLAGFGVDVLLQQPRLRRRIGIAGSALGTLTLGGLLLSYVLYPSLEPLFESLRTGLLNADRVFQDAAAFYGHLFSNVLVFGVVMLFSGLALLLPWGDDAPTSRRSLLAQSAVLVVLAVDLLVASWGFNPASDPALLDFTPPTLQWLQAERDAQPDQPWRYTVVNAAGQRDILRANAGLRYGLDDVRGYDSIISRQYVDYMRTVHPQNQLDFNRVAPLYTWDDPESVIASERFNRLNLRYIVTHKAVDFTDPALTLVHEDEALRVWANSRAYPRAFTLDDPADIDSWRRVAHTPARITANTGREKVVAVVIDTPTWLVVSETYAPGWRAYIRPADAAEDRDEVQLDLERVYDNFQGVYLPDAGAWALRLIYSPTSFQVGFFGSAISGAVVLLALGIWLWRTFVAVQDSDNVSATSRLARNSLAPILLNLFNRGIDFVFAFVMFRILGPENAGLYYYAIVVFGWFDIFTNFGLDLYLMREAGRAREQSGVLLFNTSALRLSMVVLGIPLLMAFLLLRQAVADPLNAEVLLTIALFYLGLIPGSLSKGLTSLFYAFERAEYPAAVTTVTTVSKVVLGLVALLVGWGIVGLAAVSIFTNFVTLGVLYVGGRRLLGHIDSYRPDGGRMRGMVRESWPLMLNHFLATVFFQIDIVLLEGIKGARTVGLYRVAYSWLLAINIIPAFFTQALLPVMSRQAQTDRAVLARTYSLGIKLLVSVAVPVAVVFTFLAEPLTWILGGEAYLPEGAVALQIMIWSIPIGWMNSLTQYALIAVDLQRRITGAFVIAVGFNLSANLLLIPAYGFQAAAVTTILSEMVLLVPFAFLMQSALGRLSWVDMVWRQVVAGTVMLVAALLLWPVQPLLALIASSAVYGVLLMALRLFSPTEWAMLAPVLPGRLRYRLVARLESTQ